MTFSEIFNKVRNLFEIAHEIDYLTFLYRYCHRMYYKLIGRDQMIILFNGLKMTLPYQSQFGTELFLRRDTLDWGSERLLVQHLNNDKSFIDIGANIGYYTLLAAPCSHKVYAFEPDPRVIDTLHKNISEFDNCLVLQEALYSEVTTMELNLNSQPEMNSLVREGDIDSTISVRVNTLDNFMEEHPSLKISCIKTDAEGADFDILLGGEKLLIRDQPLVLTEAWPELKLLRFAKRIGFSCFSFAKPRGQKYSPQQPAFIKVETQPNDYHIKMSFLVPDRLLSEFESLVTTPGTV